MQRRSEQQDPSLGNHLPTNCASVESLEYEMAFLVRRLEAARRRFHYGLERAHYLLLILLERNDRQSVGALAEQVNLDASTVTRQVAAMKSAGLVDKHDNPDDRRGGFVTITEAGRDAAAEVRERRLERIGQAFVKWSDEDRRVYADLIARHNDSLRDMLNED
ncbi:MarR family transcriptional regulator [Salinisphaera japonica YTM-1]|uniref:MarR family transcriptional regulator n=1 Tax=Salinisphaera japonica YTM-1 TaxID=1209778 RepID=A0A423Q1Q0_9GAMM|nr:MarR family transcriptional regulator [Salinisphaera japonica YTM-1]